MGTPLDGMLLAKLTVAPRYGAVPLAAVRLAPRSSMPCCRSYPADTCVLPSAARAPA